MKSELRLVSNIFAEPAQPKPRPPWITRVLAECNYTLPKQIPENLQDDRAVIRMRVRGSTPACSSCLRGRQRPSIVSFQNGLSNLFLKVVEPAAGAGKQFVNEKRAKLFIAVLLGVPVRHDDGTHGGGS